MLSFLGLAEKPFLIEKPESNGQCSDIIFLATLASPVVLTPLVPLTAHQHLCSSASLEDS